MADNTNFLTLEALRIDCAALADVLVDVPRGALRGLLPAQPGCEEAMHELVENQASLGEQAGITAADLELLATMTEQLAMIDARLPQARKLVEMLGETRAVIEDRRQRLLMGLARVVEARAGIRGNDMLLARYERTRAYRSATGVKAARARRRNARAAAALASEASKPPEPQRS